MIACPRCGHDSLSVSRHHDACHESHCCCWRTAVKGRCDHAASDTCPTCCKCGYFGLAKEAKG